jgi:S1-C subfamily serine protease
MWLVGKTWYNSFSDIAVLQILNLTEQKHEDVGLKLNALPPQEGTTVSAFGYPSTNIEAVITHSEDISITFRVHAMTTTGPVLRVFENRRDSSMLNFPCFEINARFEPGMSGGPVFNESGELCGIICSAITPTQGVAHIAYAASLWPILGIKIDLDMPGCTVKGPYGLFELGDVGVIAVRNWDVIKKRIEMIEEGGMRRPVLSSENAVLRD